MRSLSAPSRPSLVALVGMFAAVTLCWISGLTARHYHLSWSEGPYRDDYLMATGSGLGTASVLALGLVALAVLRSPWWLLAATAAATAHHTVLAVSAYQRSEVAPVNDMFGYGSVDDGLSDALMPGSWPLFVVVLAAVVALVRPVRTRGPRPLGRAAQAGIAATFLLAALTGLVGWYLNVYFIFEGDPEPADFQNAIVTAAGTAGLLIIGVLVVWVRWRTWFQVVPAALGAMLQAFVVVGCLDGAQAAPDPDFITHAEVEIRFSLEYAALIPTSWPLLAVLVLGVLGAVPSLRRPGSGTGRVDPWSHRPERLGAGAS